MDTTICKCLENEKSLIEEIIQIVRRYDPDFLLNYTFCWEYLKNRSKKIGINLNSELSRISNVRLISPYTPWVFGRRMVNLCEWVRKNVSSLKSYSLENIVSKIFNIS